MMKLTAINSSRGYTLFVTGRRQAFLERTAR
jgi:hypothetical protein